MQPIADLPATLAGLGLWPRRAVAALAGALSVLSMAPFFLWPVLFATLPALVWLIDAEMALAPRRPMAHTQLQAQARAAASIGWCFGFGYFLPGLFWIGEAFLVEAEKFAVLMPFAVLMMPAGLALFWAAAAAAAALVWSSGWPRIVALTLALSAAEWLRGHVLTGFPWNVLGYALTASDAMMQSASVLGIYGLTLLAVPVFAAPLVVWQDARVGRASRSAPLVAFAIAAAVIAALFGWGALRLMAPSPQPAAHMAVRLVQPSIPQREKWQGEYQRRNFERHLDLTVRNAAGKVDGAVGIDLVIWPEAAMPFRILEIPAALAAIGRVIPRGGHLAAGILRVEERAAGPKAAPTRHVFNSLAVFGDGGSVTTVYDKIHLVPFGEYLPFQAALEFDRSRATDAHSRRLRRRQKAAPAPAHPRLACARAVDLLRGHLSGRGHPGRRPARRISECDQ